MINHVRTRSNEHISDEDLGFLLLGDAIHKERKSDWSGWGWKKATEER
jgi:hypothetical protein